MPESTTVARRWVAFYRTTDGMPRIAGVTTGRNVVDATCVFDQAHSRCCVPDAYPASRPAWTAWREQGREIIPLTEFAARAIEQGDEHAKRRAKDLLEAECADLQPPIRELTGYSGEVQAALRRVQAAL